MTGISIDLQKNGRKLVWKPRPDITPLEVAHFAEIMIVFPPNCLMLFEECGLMRHFEDAGPAALHLNPCPMCGGGASMHENIKVQPEGVETFYWIECTTCPLKFAAPGEQFDGLGTAEEAAAGWNLMTRVAAPQEVQIVDHIDGIGPVAREVIPFDVPQPVPPELPPPDLMNRPPESAA